MLAMVACRIYLVLVHNFRDIRVPDLSAEQPSLVVTAADGEPLDISWLSTVTWAYYIGCGMIAIFSSVKMIKFLRINIQMSVLTQTFVEMSVEVSVFFGILALLIFMWAAMAVFLFGAICDYFKDLPTAWKTCWMLFIGVKTREDVFDKLPLDEAYNLPPEADIFYYPFTIVMTFVVLNVSTGIIMTAYTKVTDNFERLKHDSMIDVLVDRMFTDQLRDLWHGWKMGLGCCYLGGGVLSAVPPVATPNTFHDLVLHHLIKVITAAPFQKNVPCKQSCCWSIDAECSH